VQIPLEAMYTRSLPSMPPEKDSELIREQFPYLPESFGGIPRALKGVKPYATLIRAVLRLGSVSGIDKRAASCAPSHMSRRLPLTQPYGRLNLGEASPERLSCRCVRW
jgi:hypothetical protein